jgi:hypothetical protein
MRMLNRRQFAQGVGAGLLLSPFVSMLTRRPVRAAAASQTSRVLFFCTMGTHTDLWSPTNVTGENSFTFSPMTAPLQAVKDKIVLIEGLPSSSPTDGHGSPEGLCARSNGYYPVNNVAQLRISADQSIADKLVAAGGNRPIPSLLLGADTSGGQTMLWKNDQNVLPIASPSSAFTTVFGNMMPAPVGTQPNALLNRRKSILDLVQSQIQTIRSNVGAAEQAKLDLHLDSINQLEKKLTASTTAPAACNTITTEPPDSTSSHPAITDDLLHLEIIKNAFACDITRVAAIQFGTDQALQVDLPSLQGDQHNGFLHGSQTDFTNLIAFESWLATQFANLLLDLDKRPAPGGPDGKTLLEDTLVVWVRDMGEAATTHNMNSMRFVLGGSSYLKTNPAGRYMDLRTASSVNGANRHERVLLNAFEALGITDYTGFGDPSLATKTPLPGVAA